MNKARKRKVKKMAEELAREIKTPEDHDDVSGELKKILVEAALGAEMEDHVGYERHSVLGLDWYDFARHDPISRITG